jgi:PAS domain S-box-containing protein
LFPIRFTLENQLPPLASAQNPELHLIPFGAAPFILAGIFINPMAALIVGLSSGIVRAFWQSHQILDPFHFAFAAFIAACLLHQNYAGRFYDWLRRPIINSPLSILVILPLLAVATFAYTDAAADTLSALDLAFSTAQANISPLLIEGLIAGIVASVLMVGLSNLRQPVYPKIPAPATQSLNRRLIFTFIIFAISLTAVLIIVGFNRAVSVSIQLAVDQMAHDAQSVSATIPAFRSHRQHLLSENSPLFSNNPENREDALMQIYRTGDFYRWILLVDETRTIRSSYPPDNEALLLPLTNLENTAISNTLATNAPYVSPAQAVGNGNYVVSFIVPVANAQGETEAVLVGRVPDISLNELANGLQNTLGAGEGFIVDEQSQIIAHPDPNTLLTIWPTPESALDQIQTSQNIPGTAFKELQANTNTRQLVYYQQGPDHPWTVVITLPYEVVLNMALQIAYQLAWVLVVAMVLFGIYLYFLGRSITIPLTELAFASQRIASGHLNIPINTQGNDEIGHLGQAFRQMQVSLKQRLDELSLLLDVSQHVSTSIDINQGMPLILQSAIRRTGATGVRVVVLNPSGRQPLTFGEGPASRMMAGFDRQVMSLVQQYQELTLSTPGQVSSKLVPGRKQELPIKALIAMPLTTHDRFQGVFWITYRQSHTFDITELNFLRTLASQASVLVENARLFATAEGGRRRLAAVLASTSDAVIVTDPTERILLVNPAMERFFNLNASEVIGRPVTAVIESKRLIGALTSTSERARNLEIPTFDGKVLYASASTIFSNDGQTMGRVAVLHDITYLKEVDDMKSEFVATVSHDLRSPLTFMRGYATMMPMVGDLTEKQQEYVDKILNGIEQMSSLVNDLLDLGRLEAGIDLVVSQFRVSEILNSVVEEHYQPAQSKGIELIVETDNQRVPPVRGDISLIRQAVTNYVSNAIKYAPDSGRVVMSLDVEGNEVIVSVKDNGPGIPKKDQLRLFEKFYRVQQRGTATVKGSGLGLALVKSIAERHGGRAWCESEVGEGSAFYISLPISSPAREVKG